MRGGTPGRGQRENKKESFKTSAGREGGMGVALSLGVAGGPRPLGGEGRDRPQEHCGFHTYSLKDQAPGMLSCALTRSQRHPLKSGTELA